MPSVWKQLHSCWTASPAAAADGGNLSTCEEHEDTRLLSRTANHLSTCEEHEHTLSKTANNCSVKIKWKCFKFAGRCNDFNSRPLAVGAADSVPTLGDWFFFSDSAGFSISFWPFKAAQRERESYITVRSLESAHLNASVSNRTREHICVYQIRFWQPGIQQKHLFLCMMFFVQEGRTKTSSSSLGLLLLQPSELKERQYCKELRRFHNREKHPNLYSWMAIHVYLYSHGRKAVRRREVCWVINDQIRREHHRYLFSCAVSHVSH